MSNYLRFTGLVVVMLVASACVYGIRYVNVNFDVDSGGGTVWPNSEEQDRCHGEALSACMFKAGNNGAEVLIFEPDVVGSPVEVTGCQEFSEATATAFASCYVEGPSVVTVKFSKTPPQPSFTTEPANLIAGEPVNLTARLPDTDRRVVVYRWDFDADGVFEVQGNPIAHTFAAAGTFPVTVQATPTIGASGSTTQSVLVVAPTPPPPPPPPPSPPPGGAWLRMGQYIEGEPGTHPPAALRSAVFDAQGRPVVAFRAQNLIYVSRWDGASWNVVGNGPVFTPPPGDPGSLFGWPSVDIDALDRPVVAYHRGALNSTDVFVARFENGAWSNLGAGALDTAPGNHARYPTIKVGPNGPVVAWHEGDLLVVRRWDGTAWVNFGAFSGPDSAGGASPSLEVAANGDAFVAWVQYEGFLPQTIRAARGTAAGWTALGGAINPPAFDDFRDQQLMQLALGADGLPVVAYASFESGEGIEVKRWDGAAWQQLGGLPGFTPDTRVMSVSLDIAPGANDPLLVWLDRTGNSYNAQRLAGGDWSHIDNGPLLNAGGGSAAHMTAIDAAEPVIFTVITVFTDTLIEAQRYRQP
jgi:PKD repeat protein